MKDYHSSHAVAYERPSRIGFTTIDVLPFLKGRKWDEHALAFVHALQPTFVRVVHGEEKSDGITWRVTVRVDREDIIQSIYQEVEVGLPRDWEYGADARQWARQTSSHPWGCAQCGRPSGGAPYCLECVGPMGRGKF